MEQKTLLAIILSVVVLFSYEAMFVAPKHKKTAQAIQINKDTEKSADVAAISENKPENTTKSNIEAKLVSLKTTYSLVDFTNVGGTLHNVTFTGQHPLPLTNVLAIKGLEDKEFQILDHTDQKIVFAYENGTQKIKKTFTVEQNDLIQASIEISSLENTKFVLIGLDTSKLTENNQRETMLDEYSVFAGKGILRKGNTLKFSDKEAKTQDGQVQWAGFRDHYSAILVRPEFETKAFAVTNVTEKSLNIYATPANAGAQVYNFTIYAGPQNIGLMKSYGKQFEKIVAFSNFWLIDWIAKAIYYTVPFFHNISKSWGISIILVSLLIYGCTYPLTLKSMMSMKRMQQTQPKIKALQERYKGDPQKLNAEVMAIYKKEKINPLGGCLPFLLQMPVFIALYQVLWRSYYFQGKGFLWIKDLAQPDRLFTLPFSLPFLGNEVNILPVAMAGVMFLQQKISAKSMVATDEQQIMQQKMMMYFFPIFIGFIFYKFASGLSLYFTVFYLLSALTQWKMSKVK